MRTFVAAAVIAAGFLAGVPAAAEVGCKPEAAFFADKPPGVALIRIADAVAIARAVDFFNSMPPQTEESYTSAWWADQDGIGRLFVGRNGEVCGSVKFNPDVARAARRYILGEDV